MTEPKNDYYATEPKATELLCELEKFDGKIWECACWGGYMSQVLKEQGYDVKSTDLIDRGYGEIEKQEISPAFIYISILFCQLNVKQTEI